MLKVGLIGAGGAGQKRAAAVAAHEGCELVAVCDRVTSLAEQVAAAAGARSVESWESVVEDGALDVIIASTTGIQPLCVLWKNLVESCFDAFKR